MKNSRIKLFIKSLVFAFIWLIVLSIVALFITNITSYKSFEDVLFIEGLVLIFIGLFSSISADSIALFLTGGMRTYRNEINITFALSSFSLFIGGLIASLVTFII
ncbi:hypothetical protein [Clostridium tertium]|uniref:Uncharacterized protein n=1 Tax=Clostridium tertium TaxID=1559 RepID=A0A6N3A9I1_9CLOT